MIYRSKNVGLVRIEAVMVIAPRLALLRREIQAKLKTIAGDTYYDLLLFDNSLPGINGLNLLQQVRRMPHRLHTPIVILLSDPIGDEGLRAGANAVLLKPEDISAIAETITRLLKTASKTAEHRPADPGPRIDYNPSHKCLESPKPNSDRLAVLFSRFQSHDLGTLHRSAVCQIDSG
ncbi:MAG: response regulator [Gammaproteobacteria bacterium]